MKLLAIGLVFGSALFSAPQKRNPTSPELMAFFNDACWNGKFVGKADTDVHCFRGMVSGQFVRDNHVVKSSRGTYGGETVFWVDKEGKLVYAYWDTHGGFSRGEMIPTKSGFESPAEHYRGQDGTKFTIKTRWLLEPPNAYTMESVKLSGDTESRMFAIEYTRAPLAKCPGPTCI